MVGDLVVDFVVVVVVFVAEVVNFAVVVVDVSVPDAPRLSYESTAAISTSLSLLVAVGGADIVTVRGYFEEQNDSAGG